MVAIKIGGFHTSKQLERRTFNFFNLFLLHPPLNGQLFSQAEGDSPLLLLSPAFHFPYPFSSGMQTAPGKEEEHKDQKSRRPWRVVLVAPVLEHTGNLATIERICTALESK